jgi:hypothetical protein
MTTRYFRLTDDVHYPERWHLGEVEGIDNWALVMARAAPDASGEHVVKLYEPGREMDFTLNALYSVPIVSDRVRQALAGVPGLRFLPVRIEEAPSSRRFFVMVVDEVLDAVDESRSEFQKFAVDDPIRPDKAGQYKGIYKLVIDEAKAAGHPIFRLRGFLTAIIVDADVERRLQAAGVTGAVFQPV